MIPWYILHLVVQICNINVRCPRYLYMLCLCSVNEFSCTPWLWLRFTTCMHYWNWRRIPTPSLIICSLCSTVEMVHLFLSQNESTLVYISICLPFQTHVNLFLNVFFLNDTCCCALRCTEFLELSVDGMFWYSNITIWTSNRKPDLKTT